MKIQLKRNMITALGVLSPRAAIDTEELQLPDELVQAWIDSGHADRLEDEPPKDPPQDPPTREETRTDQEGNDNPGQNPDTSGEAGKAASDAPMEVKADGAAGDADADGNQSVSSRRRGRG